MRGSCLDIRFITLDDPPRSLTHLPDLAAGLFFAAVLAWIGAACVVVLGEVVLLLVGYPQFLADDGPSPAVPVVALLGPVLWIWWLCGRGQRVVRARFRQRMKRLDAIVGRPDACRRLPHRCVEWAVQARRHFDVWRRRARTRRLATILPRLEPGVVVVIDRWRSSLSDAPTRVDTPFEPIAADETERLREFNRRCLLSRRRNPDTSVLASSEEAHADSDVKEPGVSLPKRPWQGWVVNIIGWGMWAGAWVGLITLLAYLGFPFMRAVFRSMYRLVFGDRWVLWITGAVIALIVVPILVASALVVRGAWVVPGGLFTLLHPFWRRRGVVHYGRRDSSALVVDQIHHRVYFADEGLACAVATPDMFETKTTLPSATIVLAAWASTARTPARHEMLEFVGADTSP